MKNLSIAILAALSLVSFAGCKKKGGGGEAIAKMADFKDQMCKCPDKACADKVTEAMTKWNQDMAKEGGDKDASKLSEEDAKKVAAISEELTKCMSKLMAPPAPPTPPPPAAGSDTAGSAAAPPAAGSDTAGSAAAPPAAGSDTAGSAAGSAK
jgi:hypothetical protein